MRVKKHKWGRFAMYRKELELGPMAGDKVVMIPAGDIPPSSAKSLAALLQIHVAYFIPEDKYMFYWKPIGASPEVRPL